jgi:hypothetical protein
VADESIEDLNDRLVSDPDLRARFADDPVGVVQEAGIELSPDQEERLTSEGWSDKSEDELLALLHSSGVGAWL